MTNRAVKELQKELADALNGGMLNLVIDHRSGAMPLSFWKEKVRGQVT